MGLGDGCVEDRGTDRAGSGCQLQGGCAGWVWVDWVTRAAARGAIGLQCVGWAVVLGRGGALGSEVKSGDGRVDRIGCARMLARGLVARKSVFAFIQTNNVPALAQTSWKCGHVRDRGDRDDLKSPADK